MTKKKKQDSIWYSSDAAEKVRIREFWLQLSEEDRKGLVKLEKEAVLKKMKEQQRSNCSCNVCGRKKSVIEEELEILYDAYYEELEHFANDQKKKSINTSDEIKSSGILLVADDFLKNDGQKFLCLMEELAAQRLRVMEEEGDKEGMESDEEDWDDVYEEDDDSDGYDEDEDESIGEQQRMAEGRRMFQIFAAKMFEQRVLTAYREKVAQERQRRLLEELEEEEKAKEGAKLEKEKKKAAKKALKKQKEEERLRTLQKEKQESCLKEQQANALKEAERQKLALEEEEKEKIRLLEIKKQEEALAKKLAKQEAEKKEANELLQKKMAKEQLLQKKKAQEQLLQKEREQAKLRIQKEAEEKAKEDRKKEKDEKIKAAKRERKERKAREKFEKESLNLSMKSATSDKGSSSSLHISSGESESSPQSPSLKDHVSYSNNMHNVFRVDNSIHSQQLANSFSIQKIPVHSEIHQAPSNQQSTKKPPGLSPSVPLETGVAFSPLSYGLSLQSQDHSARGVPVHSALNPLGFMSQPNPMSSLSALGPDHSLTGMPLPINRHSVPIQRSQNRPPGIQVPELSPLYVDEAATLRLSGLYDEADELISGSPSASNDLLSGINKAPSSTWSSLMGNTNQLGSNPLTNPHIGLENLWSHRNPTMPSTTSIRPPTSIPPHALTHQQFVQMQSAGTFSVPSPLPGYAGIPHMSVTGNSPIGQSDGVSAWPTNRFFD